MMDNLNINKYKSLSSIQQWINTGYLSNTTYESCINKSEIFDNSLPSRTKECLQLLQRDVEKETLDAQCMKQKYCGNSSSSSVNTAIYILANMNATNKAETMAIIDGANTSVTSRSTQNIQTTQFVTDEICAKKYKHIALDNNGTNRQQYLPISKMSECVLQQNSTNENKNIIQEMQENLVTNINTLSEKVLNLNDKLKHNNTFCCNHLSDERKPCPISDKKTRNSYTSSDSSNANLSQTSKNNFVNSKIKHRKKLFTLTHSPTDLIQVQYSNKNIFKLQSNLHPALDVNWKSNQRRAFKRRKKSLFHRFDRNSMSNCHLNERHSSKRLEKTNNSIFSKTFVRTNNNEISNEAYSMNLNKSQDSTECKTNNCTNMFLSTNECINAQKQLNESTIYSEKCIPNENKKSSILTDEYIRLNPSVYLTRIPDVDIQKYKNSNKETTNSCSFNDNDKHMNLNKSQDSTECKTTKSTNMFLSTNECINAQKQLNESTIYSEKCIPNENKKSSILTDEYIRLNPSVYLTRIPDVDIQKYKNSNKETTNSCSFNDNDKHMNLNKSQDSTECKTTKSTNMFLSTNECINAQKQLNESTIYSEKCIPNANKKSSILTDEYIRLNPSVYLTRIPDVDIQKYKNSNKITTDCCSLNNNHKHRNQHSITNVSDSSNESCYQIFKCEKQRSNVSAVSKTFKSVNPYNQRVSGINEKLSTDTFDSTDDEKKSTTSQNIRTRTSFNILQNYDRNGKETARNQVKLNTSKRNSTFKNSCRRRKQKLKKTHNTTKSNLRQALLSTKNPHEKFSVVISDTTASSDMETVSNSCSSDTRKNNNKKLNMLFISDDEDKEFSRLISCPEKFRPRIDFVEETDSDECNTSNMRIVTISSKEIPNRREKTFSSMGSKSFKELKSDNNSESVSYFSEKNLYSKNLITKQSCNSSVKEDCNSQLTRKQLMLNDETKLLPNVDIVSKKNKSGVSNWCFETKHFDYDSCASSTS